MKQVAHKAAGGDQRSLRHFTDLYFRLHSEGKQELYGIELMRKLGAEAADLIEKEKAEAMLEKKGEENLVR
jgi:hypothetical protein